MRRVIVGALLCASGNALADQPKLADESLRRFVAGKTVHLDTAIGTIPITYHEDGLLSGKVESLPLRAYLGSETDRGRWQVKGDKICQKFFRWLSGETACVAFRQEGRKISWRRDDGTTGTATIAANDAAPPPPPLGLGLRTEKPLPPPPADVHETKAVAALHTPQLTPPRAPAAVAPPPVEAQARLIELPRRIATGRPPVILASAAMGGMALAPARSNSQAQPKPQMDTPQYSRNALLDLAFQTALMNAGRTWCRAEEPAGGNAMPALVEISRSREAEHGAPVREACMAAEPHILEVAKLGLDLPR